MNNILSFNIANPNDVAMQIAARVKARRLELNLTQGGMASRAGNALFAQKQYQSLEDVLNEQSVNRKRGKKNE